MGALFMPTSTERVTAASCWLTVAVSTRRAGCNRRCCWRRRDFAFWQSIFAAKASREAELRGAQLMKDAAIDRLALLASGAYTPLIRMKGRKLFILARDDSNADGPRLPRIREQYEKPLNQRRW